ncbi:MAG: hypothetical protein AB1589_14360 [Cyanobacteriota bacterium]
MYLSRLGFDRRKGSKEGTATLGRADDFHTIFSGATPMPVIFLCPTLLRSALPMRLAQSRNR